MLDNIIKILYNFVNEVKFELRGVENERQNRKKRNTRNQSFKNCQQKKNQKTYQIIREGLDKFIGDSARYLRWLVEKKYVISERLEGKNYKQWNITQKGKEYLYSLKSK